MDQERDVAGGASADDDVEDWSTHPSTGCCWGRSPDDCECLAVGQVGCCATCVADRWMSGFEEFCRERDEGSKMFGLDCGACGGVWQGESRSLRNGEEWWQGFVPIEGEVRYDFEGDGLELVCDCGEIVATFAREGAHAPGGSGANTVGGGS